MTKMLAVILIVFVNTQLKQLVVGMLPGLTPLAIFIVAEYFFDARTSLLVAISVGVCELIYYFVRHKKIELFVIFDIALLCLLGCISILFDNPLFFKLKPAIIEAILCAILALSLCTPVDIIGLMLKRYMPTTQLSKSQHSQLRRSLLLLLAFLIPHTLLIIYAAYMLPHAAWAFISGLFLYIGMAAVMASSLLYRFVRTLYYKFRYKNDEWFDIVTPEGKVTGKAPRKLCHKGPGLLHAVVHLHVFNQKGELFLQKRSLSKETQAGKWDTAVGGHVASGEPVAKALIREAAEEIGLKQFSATPLFRFVWNCEYESELVYSYFVVEEGPFILQASEIDDGKFWSMKEIQQAKGKGIFTPNLEYELTLLQSSGLITTASYTV